MRIYIGLCLLIWTLQTAYAAITQANIKTFPNSFALEFPFNPAKGRYWTNMLTRRRVCFAASPSGKIGFIAYLDASEKGVHVQQVDLQTFKPIGKAFTAPNGKEAGGLVVPDDEVGFALLTNEPLPPGTADAPKDNTPIPILYRVVGGNVAWKRFLAGPGVHPEEGLGQAVDMNGDLVWSPTKKLFAAYFVISYYTQKWTGHFADSIEYVDANGKLQIIDGATSAGGCSHNTGAALAESDGPPFASACAEDQTGSVWVNTKTQRSGPPSPLLSKEPFINGMSGEPFNGMAGSWSVLKRIGKTQQYVITWLTRNTQLPSSGEKSTTESETESNTDPNAAKHKGTEQSTKQSTEQPTDQKEDLGAKARFVRRTPKKSRTESTETNEQSTNENPDVTGSGGGSGGGKGGGGGGGGGEGGGAPPRNIAIAILTDKFTVGAKNIITKGPSDHFNVHAQAFDDKTILSTYEEISNPKCVKAAGCLGEYAGTYFAQVDTSAKVVGQPFKSTEISVGGDLVVLPSGSICFPYVTTKWDYSKPYDPASQGQQNPLTENKGTTDGKGGGGGSTGAGGDTRFRLFRRQPTEQIQEYKKKPSKPTGETKSTKAGGEVVDDSNPSVGGGGEGKAAGTQQLSFACISSPNGSGGGSGKTTTTGSTSNTDAKGNTAELETGNGKKPTGGDATLLDNKQETPQDQKSTTNSLHKRRLRRF